MQNILDNRIDDIGDEPEDTIAHHKHTVYSHTIPRDHITEGTEGEKKMFVNKRRKLTRTRSILLTKVKVNLMSTVKQALMQ